MTKGKRSQAINARLREDLAEALAEIARIERRASDADKARDAAQARLKDAEDNGDPVLRQAVLRAQNKETVIDGMIHESERMNKHVADALRDSLRILIRNAIKQDISFITADFRALMGDLYPKEFPEWLNEFGCKYYNRSKRRSETKMPPEELKSRIDAASSYGNGANSPGRKAIEAAKQRRAEA
jgi:hypothetical protein